MYSKFLIFSFCIFFHFNLISSSVDQDYCVGFLEEVYWSLDPIEDEIITPSGAYNSNLINDELM